MRIECATTRVAPDSTANSAARDRAFSLSVASLTPQITRRGVAELLSNVSEPWDSVHTGHSASCKTFAVTDPAARHHNFLFYAIRVIDRGGDGQ